MFIIIYINKIFNMCVCHGKKAKCCLDHLIKLYNKIVWKENASLFLEQRQGNIKSFYN